MSLVLALNTSSLLAQKGEEYQDERSIKSPTAGDLGKYGEVPVSLFNGLPQVTVPLAQLECGDIKVPMQLQYYAGGNKPDVHPGWIGLGWSLQAGGLITRQTNGVMDELLVGHDPTMTYFDRRNDLAVSNWSQQSYLNSYTGADLSPDEFNFSFNGISGSFYLNYDGTWKVKSKENLNIKIQSESQWDYYHMPRTFTKFILTTNDGFQYVFGGDQSAIEISLPSLQFVPPLLDPTYYQNHPPGLNIQSTAWHLTEIISPSGNSVKFYYSADVPNFSQVNYMNLYNLDGEVDINGADYYLSRHLILAHYLDKIEGSNGVIYSFEKSLTNELKYVPQTNPYPTSFAMYSINVSTDQYYKLDNIVAKYKDLQTQKISFKYIENANERLKLQELVFNANDATSAYTYGFAYNVQKLPVYNTWKLDHWSFYNGKMPVSNGKPTDGGAAYFQSREPDAAFASAEMLERITYPTKGYTEFYFEPHDYSKNVIQYPSVSCVSVGGNKIAGGARVRKIVSYDGGANKPRVREYLYIKNYVNNGTESSGVLSGTPKYYQEGSATSNGNTIYFWQLQNNSFNYLNNTNGNHVTYTEVVEKNGDEGFVIHTFSNQDNGYLDKPAFAAAAYLKNLDASFYTNKTFGKLELERGLPLSVQYYSKDKKLLKEEVNQYNDDPARFNEYVRAIEVLYNLQTGVSSKAAFPIYTFYPFLKKKTVRETVDGVSLESVTDYVYDNTYKMLRSETSTNSKTQVVKKEYKYPFDMTTATQDPAGIYRDMVNKNIITPVIEETHFTNGAQKFLKTVEYYNPYPGVFVPKIVKEKIGNYPETVKAQFHEYNSKGNLLDFSKENDLRNVYLWGYNGQYPVALITGSDYNTVKQFIDQAILNNPTDDNQLRTTLDSLRSKLQNALVSTYTYKPTVGLTSETNANNITTYYEYDSYNRLKTIRDRNGKILKQFCYSFDGQLINCDGATTFYFNDSISKSFLRTCPENYTPEPYTYQVPGKKYVSVINLGDANRKAWDEVNTYGQKYADAYGTCKIICNTATCYGDNKKCINGVCETAVRIVTSSVKDGPIWRCVFYYRWSDGSTSPVYSGTSPTPCQ